MSTTTTTIDSLTSDEIRLIFIYLWPTLFSAKPTKRKEKLAYESHSWAICAILSHRWYKEVRSTRKNIRQLAHNMTMMWTNETIKTFPRLVSLRTSNSLNLLNPLKNIKRLDLSRNTIIKDDQLKHWTHLESLILDKNRIITDESLRYLTNIRQLSLDNNNNITSDGVVPCKLLTNLSLASNTTMRTTITEIPLILLKRLNINNNTAITNASLGTYTTLKHLNLSYNYNISDRTLIKLTNLKSLVLERNNTITNNALYKLSRLEELDLTDNVTISDESLTEMKLKNLYLSHWTDISLDHVKTTKRWTDYSNFIIYMNIMGVLFILFISIWIVRLL